MEALNGCQVEARITRDYSQALKPHEISSVAFHIFLGLGNPFIPLNLSLLEWKCLALILCLFYHSILRAGNLLFSSVQSLNHV